MLHSSDNHCCLKTVSLVTANAPCKYNQHLFVDYNSIAEGMLAFVEKKFRAGRHDYSTGYVLAREVEESNHNVNCRRLDAVLVNLRPSGGFSLTGVEVKADRSDLMKELSDPAKAHSFYKHLDFFILAVSSPEIVKGLDIPKEWGIYFPNGKGSLRAQRKEKPLHPGRVSSESVVERSFMMALIKGLIHRGGDMGERAKTIEAVKKEGFLEGQASKEREIEVYRERYNKLLDSNNLSGLFYHTMSENELKILGDLWRAHNEPLSLHALKEMHEKESERLAAIERLLALADKEAK